MKDPHEPTSNKLVCYKCGSSDLMGTGREVLICRACTAEKVRRWRASNPERSRALAKDSDARRREKRRLYDRKQFEEPMFKARRWLYRQVKSGKIIKPEICDVCSSPTESGQLFARHVNLEHPGEVIWMCPGCRKSTRTMPVKWGKDRRPREVILVFLKAAI